MTNPTNTQFDPTDTQLAELGHAITEIAYEIFCKCDSESDFCVNNTNGIFGGVNRLRITSDGWVASEHHCSERFLNKWREIQGGQGVPSIPADEK